MRRLPLLILSAALLLGACSGGRSHSASKTITTTAPAHKVIKQPALYNNHPPSLVSADRVGSKPYCSSVDGFCVTFPYLDSNDSRFPNFRTDDVPASQKDGTPEFRGYNSELTWGYSGTKLVFCRSNIDPICYDKALVGSGVPQDTYSVFVWADEPGKTLEQMDLDCQGWRNRHATNVTLAGQPALHVTCNYTASPKGVHDLYFVRHGGRVYEVGAFDQVRSPFFSPRFFSSFRFTD